MWLQLSQILKEHKTEGNARRFNVSFAFCVHLRFRLGARGLLEP